MRYSAITECHAASEVGQVLDVRRSHDSFIENSNVNEQLVESYILLSIGSDQIVKLKSGDRKNWLSVEFCVIEPIKEMNSAWARCCQTNPQFTGELCVSACHKRSSFFVSYLNETNLFLMSTK